MSANPNILTVNCRTLTHAAVNNELNRITGLRKVSEATVEDLERRLARAEKWLEQESSRHIAG